MTTLTKRNESSLNGFVYVTLSSVFSSIGSLLVVPFAGWLAVLAFMSSGGAFAGLIQGVLTSPKILIGVTWLYAIIVYIPCSGFSLAANRFLPEAEVLFLFEFITIFTDVAAGLLQGNRPLSWKLLFLAIALATVVFARKWLELKSHSSTGDDYDMPATISRLELGLYVLMMVLIVVGMLFPYWPVGILVFMFTEYGGINLASRIALCLRKTKLSNSVVEMISGSLGFAPSIFASVVVLTALENIAVAGLLITTGALVGPYFLKWLFDEDHPIPTGYDVVNIVLAVLAGTAVYMAFPE
jgi:hypothetical protein